jgi:hypothetical protein
MTRLHRHRIRRDFNEEELRALYYACGLSKETTDAAVKLRQEENAQHVGLLDWPHWRPRISPIKKM